MYPEYLRHLERRRRRLRHGVPHGAQAPTRPASATRSRTGSSCSTPTPFSDTDAIAVTFDYAVAEPAARRSRDLRQVAHDADARRAAAVPAEPRPGCRRSSRRTGSRRRRSSRSRSAPSTRRSTRAPSRPPTSTRPTPSCSTGDYRLLRDPEHVFGWGNVVPVASAKVLDAEGPAFAATINRVSALLTLPAMRQLNAAVDVSQPGSRRRSPSSSCRRTGCVPPVQAGEAEPTAERQPLEPKPPAPRSDRASSSTSTTLGRLERDQHELGDPVAGGERERLGPVGVEQQHPQLAAVAGVDQPGRVDQRDPVRAASPERGSTRPAWPSGISTAIPVRTEARSPGAERGRLERVQVEPGVARVGPGRQRARGVEPPDPQASSRGRARARTRCVARGRRAAGSRAVTRTPSAVSSRSRSPAISCSSASRAALVVGDQQLDLAQRPRELVLDPLRPARRPPRR